MRATFLVPLVLATACAPRFVETSARLDTRDAWARGRPLERWTQDADAVLPGARARAIEAIGVMGPAAADAVPTLARALRDESPRVRQLAAWALARIGPAAAPATPALLLALQGDGVPEVRREAQLALARIGPAARKELLVTVRSDDAVLRRQSLAALAALRDPRDGVEGAIVSRLDDPDPAVRDAALQALGAVAPDSKRLAKQLQRRLDATWRDGVGRDAAARETAVAPLLRLAAGLGPRARPLAPRLANIACTGPEPLATLALDALVPLGRDAERELVPYLRSTDESEATRAALGLLRVGRIDRGSLRFVKKRAGSAQSLALRETLARLIAEAR